MGNNQYFGVFIYLIGILVLSVFMLLCGYFLGGRSYSRFKDVPFESGIKSVGTARIEFSIRFYLIAMIFVIFDIEGIYLYVWSVSIRESGWVGFFEAFLFIFILLSSLVYLICVGAFDWIKNPSKCNENVMYVTNTIRKMLADKA